MINVNIKKLVPEAVIPTYAHPGDAGMDVTAVSMNVTDKYIEYGTGLSFELPEGYVMLIFPRSSVSKYDLSLANAVGVLDSGYRGELKLRFKRNYRIENVPSEDSDFKATTTSIVNLGYANEYQLNACNWYNVGDKIGQIMILPYPTINFTQVDDLSDTERGSGGFGSPGISNG